MVWTPPSTTWQTAESPFNTDTGVLRLTLLGNDNMTNNTREVSVGELLMSRGDGHSGDRGLLVPGGLLLGRRTADYLPDTFSSRVLSRSHAQFLLGTEGRIYLTDLGSMHGTKLEGAKSKGTIVLRPRNALELRDGDLVTLGKSVESKNGNHAPLRMRVNLRFAKDSLGERHTAKSTDFASKAHLADVARHLGLEARRRGYGLDESVLYESEEDPLPRGTPLRDAFDDINDEVVQHFGATPSDKDDSIVFLSQSSPAKAPVAAQTEPKSPPSLLEIPLVPLPWDLPKAPDAELKVASSSEVVPVDASVAQEADAREEAAEPMEVAESDDDVESYPTKFIPSSFPAEDDTGSPAASDREESVAESDDDADKENVLEDDGMSTSQYKDWFNPYDEYEDIPDDNEEEGARFGSPTLSRNSSCRFDYMSADESNEENSEDSDSEGEGESDYHSEGDGNSDANSDSHMDSDDDNESTNPAMDETPGEIEWRCEQIFDFTAPSHPQSVLVTSTGDASAPAADAEMLPANSASNNAAEPQACTTSQRQYDVNSYPPSPPLSTGAESSDGEMHSQIVKDLNKTLAAARFSQAARCGTKRGFADMDAECEDIKAPTSTAAAVASPITMTATTTTTTTTATTDAGTNPAPVTVPAQVVPVRPAKLRRVMKTASVLAMGIAIGSIGTIAGLLQMAD